MLTLTILAWFNGYGYGHGVSHYDDYWFWLYFASIVSVIALAFLWSGDPL